MLPFLNPRSPNSMLSLYHGILPKVVSALFTTLNWGEGETKFVLSMFNNFVQLAGMVSKVLSKIVKQNPKRLWSIIKNKSKSRNIPNTVSSAVNSGTNQDPARFSADNPTDIANMFNRYFTSVYTSADNY